MNHRSLDMIMMSIYMRTYIHMRLTECKGKHIETKQSVYGTKRTFDKLALLPNNPFEDHGFFIEKHRKNGKHRASINSIYPKEKSFGSFWRGLISIQKLVNFH